MKTQKLLNSSVPNLGGKTSYIKVQNISNGTAYIINSDVSLAYDNTLNIKKMVYEQVFRI